MSKIIKLGMLFDENAAPDFGDIVRSASGELTLTSSSLSKMTDNLTAAVCGAAFNISAGTQAWVIDTGDVLAYHPDAWHFVKRNARKSDKYGSLQVCVSKNGSSYILDEENEKIIFSVISGGQTVLSKELHLWHYKGNGLYGYSLNLEDAHTIHDIGKNYTVNVYVYNGETDITATVDITHPDVMEWYDVHVIYDTGV